MIVYVNGDSYPAVSGGLRYSEFLGQYYNCESINAAIAGSCNDRILRTSLRDLMQLKEIHDDIKVVISLSFILRTELWDTDRQVTRFVNDGDFVSFQSTHAKNWTVNPELEDSKFKQYTKQWLTWYNVEAITTNLLKDILLFSSWCTLNKIKYVILSGPLLESIDFTAPFIASFYNEMKSNESIINPFEVSFTEWCLSHNFIPIDHFTQAIHGKEQIVGHHGEEAHRAFSDFLVQYLT